MYKITKIEPGMTFGRLTVVGKHHRDKERRKTYYTCRCECGKEAVVYGYNLTTGKTRSCGCLRSDSVNMIRGSHKRVKVSERTKTWIINHYKHTKNADIMRKYGLSEGWLHRFAREHGLKKTTQFRHTCQKEMVKAAAFSHFINNSYPPKGYRIPGSADACFQKGVTNLQRLGKRRNDARIAKSAESRRKTWKLEHARKTFGLPQETKLRVMSEPKQWTSRRYLLRKRGYIVDRGGLEVYYTPETRRSRKLESYPRPFRFHELTTQEA